MNFIWRICLIIIFLILEVSLLSFLLPRYLVPNLVLICLVVWLVLLVDFKTLLVLMFLSGVVLDFFSGLAIGTSALSFLIIILLLQIIKTRFFTKPTFWQIIVLILLASVFYWLFIYLEVQFLRLVHWNDFGQQFSWVTSFAMISQLMANLFFGVGVYFLLKKLEKQ